MTYKCCGLKHKPKQYQVFGKLYANCNGNDHFPKVFFTKGNPQRHALIKAKSVDAGPALEGLLRMNAGSIPTNLAFEVANPPRGNQGHHTALCMPALHNDLAGGTAGPDSVEEQHAGDLGL